MKLFRNHAPHVLFTMSSCRRWPWLIELGHFTKLALLAAIAIGSFTTSRAEAQQTVSAQAGQPFRYFVGIVGSPASPDVTWSDDELEKIRALGVNVVQLSIAWGGRPAGEVLNLEDLTAEQKAKWAFRIKQAKKHGLRVLAQFGIPRQTVVPGLSTAPVSILDPKVREKYDNSIRKFMMEFPEVNDVMVYTEDQDAWIASEFGSSREDAGIPLEDRLPGFLDLLQTAMQRVRPGSRLWWKPWLTSRGEALAILGKVKAEHFGLIVNPWMGADPLPVNDRGFDSDLGVKRLVVTATERRIPVIGEFTHTFYKGDKGYAIIGDYFPRLVYAQLAHWKAFPGVVGVKEYFGFAPDNFSVNAAMVRAFAESPDASLEQLLTEVAKPYGSGAAPLLIQAWERVARSLEAFPWDLTVNWGDLGMDPKSDGSHDWNPCTISGTWFENSQLLVNWRSTYTLMNEPTAHPWVFEDAALSLEDSAVEGMKAVELFDEAIAQGGPLTDEIRMQRATVWKMARSFRGKSLHILETLTAEDARVAAFDPGRFAIIRDRLDHLIVKDLENQRNSPVVATKLAEFRRDPRGWLKVNLAPQLDGVTKTTPDWTKWNTENRPDVGG